MYLCGCNNPFAARYTQEITVAVVVEDVDNIKNTNAVIRAPGHATSWPQPQHHNIRYDLASTNRIMGMYVDSSKPTRLTMIILDDQQRRER